MKEEDLDWVIYHRLSEMVYSTPEEIAAETGLSIGDIEESLGRLEKALLVSRMGVGCRQLSFQEAMLFCRGRFDPTSPVYFENGVVKARKDRER